jgi:superfamily II DNA or RNA helicase
LQLRPYQEDVRQKIYAAWQDPGVRNVMPVVPTGGGKTVIFSSILHAHQGYSMSIAHRQELVAQISMSLAREGVAHRVFAPTNLIKFLINEQIRELGTSFYSTNAMCAVAGVDTLLRRADQIRPFLNNVTLWIQDEGHHVLQTNKWGKAAELMPNAFGLAPTATPIRADGKGLGRHADGLMDRIVEGPSMRWLIDNGYLTDYRIFAPPSDLNLESVDVSKVTGDYNPNKLKKAVQESHLVGDVVEHYLRIAPDKLGVTFATDVETATEIANKFNQRGVPAEVVSAKTPDHIRAQVIRRFRNRELMQLVNVDLFGEGFDLPAIEVVSMARPTQSYSLYAQQFGRALRIMEGKDVAIIIDHAGNVVRHGLPDSEREWSLDRRGSKPRAKKPDDEIPLRYCPECTQPYQRTKTECPYCGHHPVPADRSRPEYVDGDLFELSPTVLAEMRAAVAKASETPEQTANRMRYAGAPEAAVRSMLKKSGAARDARAALKESIAWWAGAQNALGRSDAESYRLFYHLFGMDVLTAQTLGSADTLELADKINHYLGGGFNGK